LLLIHHIVEVVLDEKLLFEIDAFGVPELLDLVHHALELGHKPDLFYLPHIVHLTIVHINHIDLRLFD